MPIGEMSWFWKMSGAAWRHSDAVIMIGGGSRVFDMLAAEGSGELVVLIILVVPGESVDGGSGGPVSEISVAVWELSDET